MAGPDRRSFLDRPAARVLALMVFLVCVASLVYLHRNDIFPKPDNVAATAGGDPAAPCIEERFADIEKMLTDGTIENPQAELFRQRAEAMCRDTAGGHASPGPSLPSLPKE
ncbi:MAG: hypothetical protein ACR2QH_17530 [Geminicoccaceae bacterium]